MQEKQPFFSVIMPVYNAEKTINIAIGSILTQTFTNYELIIVENGSTDKSLSIANAYEAAFPKVHLFRSDPRGVSKARNTGLEHAKGEYIVFIDADDSYIPCALETMYDALMRCRADVLICGFTTFTLPDTGRIQALSPALLHLALLDPAAYEKECFECNDRARVKFALRHQCSRAYKRSFLVENGIRFDERCPICVDLLFNAKAYAASKTPHCLYRRLYSYNRNDGSLVGRRGKAFIADAAKAFAVMGELIETDECAQRAASINALFDLLASMINACAQEYTRGAFDMLCEVFETKTAKTVIDEIRSDNLSSLPKRNELLKSLLALLRSGDLGGAVQFLKNQEVSNERSQNINSDPRL